MSNQLLNKDQISNIKPGWSHPVLPGHAVQGSVLMTRTDFVNPPQSSENFIWMQMEDVFGVHDMKLEYNSDTNMYELLKSYGHLNNDGTWIEDWYKIGAWTTISEELEEALKKLVYFEYKFTASSNSLIIVGVKEDQSEVQLASISFVSPTEYNAFVEDINSRLTQEVNRATAKEADLEESIEEEVTRASNKENQIVQNLNNEITRATGREDTIEANLTAEVTRATTRENEIEAALNAEITRATNKEQDLQDQIDDNKENLADYIGSFATKAALDAYTGEANNNDYAVVLSDETHSNQCWRYIFNKTANAWLPQYMVNETPLTQAQLDALNSGITAEKVALIGKINPGNGLQVTGTGDEQVLSVKAGNGFGFSSDGTMNYLLGAGLEVTSNRLHVKVDNDTIKIDADGKLYSEGMPDTGDGLDVVSDKLVVKAKSNGGISVSADGVAVDGNTEDWVFTLIDTSQVTKKIMVMN